MGWSKIVDVSRYQAGADMSGWAGAGVAAVYSEVVDGWDGINPAYSDQRATARAAGLDFGAYVFCRFGLSPVTQIDRMIDLAGGDLGNRRPQLDCEAPDNPLGPDDTCDWLLAAAQHLVDRGYPAPWIYSARWWWDGRVTPDPRLAAYPLWVAGYPTDDNTPPEALTSRPAIPAPWDEWLAWQYTEHGQLPGWDGSIDLSVIDTSRLAELGGGTTDPGALHLMADQLEELKEFTQDAVSRGVNDIERILGAQVLPGFAQVMAHIDTVDLQTAQQLFAHDDQNVMKMCAAIFAEMTRQAAKQLTDLRAGGIVPANAAQVAEVAQLAERPPAAQAA